MTLERRGLPRTVTQFDDPGLPDPLADPRRLAAVRRLLDAGVPPPAAAGQDASEGLNRLTRLAARLLGTRHAQISLLTDVQVAVAAVGLSESEAAQVRPAHDSLCSVVVQRDAPVTVPEARRDPQAENLSQVARGQLGSYLGAPLRNAEGLLLGALCVYDPQPRDWRDSEVTVLTELAASVVAELELRAVTAELTTSSTRLELALGAASIGSFELTPETGELQWDKRLIELFGYEPGSFVPHLDSFTARLHPDDRERVLSAIQEAVSNRGQLSAEYRIVLPSGTVRWMSSRGHVVTDESGRAVRLLGAAYDSTAVRTGGERLGRVLETMTSAFFSLDTHWRFTYVNAQAEMILARPRQELLGRSIWEEFPAAVGTAFDREYHRAFETGETVAFEEYYPAPLDRWYEVRAWPSPDGLNVYFHDISDSRRAERERETVIAERELAVVERERALTEASTAQARLELLTEITRALVNTLDVDEAMARLAGLVVPRLGDWAAVTLLDDVGNLYQSVARHRDGSLSAEMLRFAALHTEVATPESDVRTVARTGQPVLRKQVAPRFAAQGSVGDELADLVDRIGLATLIVVPLQARERTLGVLVLAGGPEHRAFDEQDLATAVELGQRAGLAVDNARLYDRQRKAAEVLQRSLLTRLPDPDHLEIAARYLPAAQEAQVGGDWWDAFLQPDGATVLVIGDVVGHDMGAAAAMGQLRNLLRGIAYDQGHAPATILRRVDAAIEGLQIDTLATAAVVRIEQHSGMRERGLRGLRWSNAGHPPPMLLKSDGTVLELDAGTDLLLGLDPHTERSDSEIFLEAGDTVLLYTDGLVERRDSQLDTGLARLRQALAALVHEPLESLLDQVLTRLLPADAEDDVALLAVRAHPE